MVFLIVQVFYWIALSTWFGSLLAIALAAPVIFRTVEEGKPILSNVLSVNLDGQHGTLLAGTIVTNLIQRLHRLEAICGGTLLLMLILQLFVINLSPSGQSTAILRSALFILAAGIVAFDWRIVWPKISKFRAEYIDHADEPDIANPAKDLFDIEQRRSLTLLTLRIAVLLGMILFSSNISAPPNAVLSSHGPTTPSSLPPG